MLSVAALIISVVGSLGLGGLVLYKEKKSHLNIIFFLLTVSVALWAVANYFSLATTDTGVMLVWIRSTMFLAVWQSVTFFLFIHTFPNSQLQLKRKYLISLLAFSIVTSIVSFTPLLFSHLEFSQEGAVTPVAGPGMVLFMLNSILFILIGLIILLKKRHKSGGILRSQFNYILGGFLLMFFSLIFFNFVLVNIFQNSEYVDFGALYLLPFIVSTSYAIVRYRLMDIRTIISRSIVYAVLVSIVTAGFTLATYLGSIYISQDSQVAQLAILAVASLMIVILIDPIKNGLARATNKIFFKAAIDYPEVTKKLTAVINEEIHLSQLVQRFSSEIAEDLRLTDAMILLPVGEDAFLAPEELQSSRKPRKKKSNTVFFNSPFIKYLKRYKAITILDELDHKVSAAKTTRERNQYDRVRKNFEEIDCYAAVPVVAGKKIEAILILSRKLSGEAFSTDDVQLLEVIAPQMASGIQKARLYQESQEFNTKLQREVERATKKLRDANGKLKELDKAKSEFMSIASHQLRTPLAGIIGYLSMLEEGDFGDVKEEQQQVIHDIREGSQRLARLVNIFLNVTRIEAGRFVMNFVKVPFHEVIEAMYKELKPTADKKNVKLVYKKTTLPEVEVDVDKIKDVILNLTDNAIKYTPEGTVTVSAEATKRTVHVMVKDTGVGIEPDEAENLFSKFVRGSDIANVQPNGSGLGLFIAKKIAEGHGGRIWAESEGKGKGSTFNFEIPIKADKEAKKKSEEFKKKAKE